MHKAIYIALSGALMKQAELELVSENIANARTPGFKNKTISFTDYLVNDESQDGRTMTYVSDTKIDMAPGTFLKTGRDLDIAIEGKGFLSLEGGFYTRRGDMARTKDGYLVNSSGKRVLGTGGPVRIPKGNVEIREDGSVYVDGSFIDRLRIVEFESPGALKKIGEGLFEAISEGRPSSSTVLSGYIEESNVDIVKELVRMITGLREFETFQKAIQTLDEAASKINNEMGRL